MTAFFFFPNTVIPAARFGTTRFPNGNLCGAIYLEDLVKPANLDRACRPGFLLRWTDLCTFAGRSPVRSSAVCFQWQQRLCANATVRARVNHWSRHQPETGEPPRPSRLYAAAKRQGGEGAVVSPFDS